jgi:exopolysaccharide biosynthesis WecB/TagA/CpsF family protein
MMRILVVQLGDIGDLVLSTPALAALRQAHPDAQIAVLTPPHAAPILTGTGLADVIIEQKRFPGLRQIPRLIALAGRLRAGRFDVTLFFHHFTTRAGRIKFAALAYAAGSPRRIGLDAGGAFFLTERLPDAGFGARHQAQYWLDLVALLGADPTPRPTRVGITGDDRAFATAALGESAQPYVVIHAGSGGDSYARRWSPEGFAQVADDLAASGLRVVLVGGPGDDTRAVRQHLRADCIDLSGRTTLGQLAAVIERASLFIGADSGVMHIASATDTPIAAIFGPSNPEAWRPWRPSGGVCVLRSAPECSPCSYVEYRLGQRAGCAARTCMRLVTPAQVTAAARMLLSGSVPSATPPVRPRPPVPTIRILGLPVSVITFARWLDLIAEWVQDGQARHVCTINPEMVMIARRDPIFRVILERADLTVPDGVGLLWAARRLGTPLPERVTGSDGVPLIAARAAQAGWRLFLLGAAEGVAARAAAVLRQRYPGVQIVGTYAGSPAPHEEDAIVERVNASGADILFVAYGAPEQDKWIARNLPRLRVKMAMGVGGSLDFVAGVVPRAPERMRRLGLEWLYRLYLQPWRIKRMLRLPRFVLAVLLHGARG